MFRAFRCFGGLGLFGVRVVHKFRAFRAFQGLGLFMIRVFLVALPQNNLRRELFVEIQELCVIL